MWLVILINQKVTRDDGGWRELGKRSTDLTNVTSQKTPKETLLVKSEKTKGGRGSFFLDGVNQIGFQKT